MATFLRRTFAKLSESRRAPQVGATFSRPEGAITLTAREAARYGMLMTMLDTDSDDQIGGAEGASFLRRSGLDTGACAALAPLGVRPPTHGSPRLPFLPRRCIARDLAPGERGHEQDAPVARGLLRGLQAHRRGAG